MSTRTGRLMVEPKNRQDRAASDKALAGAAAASNPASPTTAGVVKQAAAIADLTAAPTQADFNGLLAKLRAAGQLATS